MKLEEGVAQTQLREKRRNLQSLNMHARMHVLDGADKNIRT